MMETTIRIETEFGEARFDGQTAKDADKAMKKALRKAGVSVNDLAYYREIEMHSSREILYGYTPMRPSYCTGSYGEYGEAAWLRWAQKRYAGFFDFSLSDDSGGPDNG